MDSTGRLPPSRWVLFTVGLCLVGFPPPAAAQLVRGLVVDSVSGSAVDGGTVALLNATGTEVRRTRTDPVGQFLIRAPGPGTYRLRALGAGFRESLFPPFELAADTMLTFQLLVPSVDIPAPPSGADIVADVCPTPVPPEVPVVVGVVSDAATGRPVAGAQVRLSWSDLPDGLARLGAVSDARGTAEAGSTGFYAVCGVPTGTDVQFVAEHLGDLSPPIIVRFRPTEALVGGERIPMLGQLFRLDLPLQPPRRRRGSVVGLVTDTTGRRIANATVRVWGTTRETRADLFGQFQMAGLPDGTYRLRAELVGYEPGISDAVVVSGEALDLTARPIVLTAHPPQLDPITVRAERPQRRRDLREFLRRRETTTGQFLTREEFEQQGNARRTTDLLRRLRGIRVEPGLGALEWWITTNRGAARSGTGACWPLVYVDRQFIGTTEQVDVDQVIPLVNVEALEAYVSSAGMPLTYNRPGAVCGVIAFWTR